MRILRIHVFGVLINYHHLLKSYEASNFEEAQFHHVPSPKQNWKMVDILWELSRIEKRWHLYCFMTWWSYPLVI